LFDECDDLIVKSEFGSGGRGNEILSRRADVLPIGARRVHQLSSDEAIERYVSSRWDSLSERSQRRVVVERYYENSNAVFCEFAVTDSGVRAICHGDLLSDPYFTTSVLPSQKADVDTLRTIVEYGLEFADIARALGYRGVVAPDAILTTVGDVLFTEWNIRETGTSHIHLMASRLVGESYVGTHTIVDTIGPQIWCGDDLATILAALERRGINYDAKSKTGVVISCPADKSSPPRIAAIARTYLAACGLIREAYQSSLCSDNLAPV
jgi:hypothetical protein